MRDINRIDVTLSKLNELWKLLPDYRFGQLMIAIELPKKYHGQDSFFWEEKDWDEIFQYNIDKIKDFQKNKNK